MTIAADSRVTIHMAATKGALRMRTWVALIACMIAGVSYGEELRFDAVVTLAGVLESHDAKDPDGKPVTYPALKLDAPVTVVADPRDELSETEENVPLVQLVLSSPLLAEYTKLQGQKVSVTGKLMHALSGHHHTAVLIVVRDLVPTAAK